MALTIGLSGAAPAGATPSEPTHGTFVDPPTDVRATNAVGTAPGAVTLTWTASVTDASIVGEYEIFLVRGASPTLGGWSTTTV